MLQRLYAWRFMRRRRRKRDGRGSGGGCEEDALVTTRPASYVEHSGWIKSISGYDYKTHVGYIHTQTDPQTLRHMH